MAIKMRYLYFSGKKKVAALGQHVKTKYDLSINSVDVIPPAYSCDKERGLAQRLRTSRSAPLVPSRDDQGEIREYGCYYRR